MPYDPNIPKNVREEIASLPADTQKIIRIFLENIPGGDERIFDDKNLAHNLISAKILIGFIIKDFMPIFKTLPKSVYPLFIEGYRKMLNELRFLEMKSGEDLTKELLETNLLK